MIAALLLSLLPFALAAPLEVPPARSSATLQPSAAALHPMDGPDADLTIRLDEDALRIRISLNLAYLDATVETARENAEFIHPVEVGGVRDALLEHWLEELGVTIDGVTVQPLDESFEVFDADPMLLPLFPRMGRLALTRVDHHLAWPLKSTPDRVEITWPDFPDDVQQPLGDGTFAPLEINGRLTALGRESLVQFSQADPRYVWVREEASRGAEPLPVPSPVSHEARFPVESLLAFLAGTLMAVVLLRRAPLAAALVLVVAGGAAYALRDTGEDDAGFQVPDEAAALAAFQPLHSNLYRAFDYEDESAIYDALAQSAEGPLLDTIYQEVYESRQLEADGGARSFVRSVDPLETRVTSTGNFPPDDAPGFVVDARWRVEGQVFHWGHSHTRTNLYRARYTVVVSGGRWRLRASEVLEHERKRAANDTDEPAPAPRPQRIPEEL